jgi:hypothetical protein
MAETITTGKTVDLADTDAHEYQFDGDVNKTFKSNLGPAVRTVKIICEVGTIQIGIGEEPGADSKEYAAGEFDLFDFVNGSANIFIKGSNPSSFTPIV